MFIFKKFFFLFFIFLFLIISHVESQDKFFFRSFSIGVKGHMSKVIPHRSDISYLKGSRPIGAEFDLGFLEIKPKIWRNNHPYYKHGFAFSYFNYDSKFFTNKEFDHFILGEVYQCYRYIEPFYDIRTAKNKNLFFSFRLGLGLSYLDNPYSVQVENLTYSVRLNGYFTGNINLYYYHKSHFFSSISLCMHHNSNGGIDKPNLGINYPSLSLGFYYIFNPRNKYLIYKESLYHDVEDYNNGKVLIKKEKNFRRLL